MPGYLTVLGPVKVRRPRAWGDAAKKPRDESSISWPVILSRQMRVGETPATSIGVSKILPGSTCTPVAPAVRSLERAYTHDSVFEDPMTTQSELPLALRTAYMALHRRSEAVFGEQGVTADQFVLLATLSRGQALTQRELARRMP